VTKAELEKRIAAATPYGELKWRVGACRATAADRARLAALEAERLAWAREAAGDVDWGTLSEVAWRPVEVPEGYWRSPWDPGERLEAALAAAGVDIAAVAWSGDRTGPEVQCASVRACWTLPTGATLRAALGFTARATWAVDEWLTLAVEAPQRLGGGWVTLYRAERP
jgi:hypothetical protein